jgi:hypothetical protein
MPFIKGKAVRVVVKHEEATQGKSKGKVFPVVTGFKESTVGGSLSFAKDGQQSGNDIDIDSEDLPF